MYKNFKKIQFWAEDRIGLIALDNGNENILDTDLLSEMISALTIAMYDNSTDIITITGTGSIFSKGMGICEDTLKNKNYLNNLWNLGHTVSSILLSIQKIVVIILNGNAIDAGLELALMGDIILSKKDLKVGFPGQWYGVPFFIGTPALFSSIYGRNFYYKLLSKKIFHIEELNIVTEYFSEKTLMQDAKNFIKNLPIHTGKFKGELLNILRNSLDYERYNYVASTLEMKFENYKKDVKNLF